MKSRMIWLLLTILILLSGCKEDSIPAWSVTIDGRNLSCTAVDIDGTVCLPESELEAALDTDVPNEFVKVMDSRNWVPVYDVCEALNISVLEDREEEHLYLTTGILGWEVPEGYAVPVLMYHGISDDVWGDESMFLSPSDMEDHLRYLSENGYDAIFFEDLAHPEQYDKPVLLTFDDGYVCNYTNLYPLLQKYQMKATISIVTSSMDKRPSSMTSEMVKELADSGLVSIQSHTINHAMLTKCSLREKKYEIVQSKLEVTRMTGKEPLVMCYPGGMHNNRIVSITRKNYRFGIIVQDGVYTTGMDPFRIPRFNIYRGITMEEFVSILDSVDYSQNK
jgi:peptidoglycan/xylan/chitin deacetylase (PgdA/CDA1 family)